MQICTNRILFFSHFVNSCQFFTFLRNMYFRLLDLSLQDFHPKRINVQQLHLLVVALRFVPRSCLYFVDLVQIVWSILFCRAFLSLQVWLNPGTRRSAPCRWRRSRTQRHSSLLCPPAHLSVEEEKTALCLQRSIILFYEQNMYKKHCSEGQSS